MDYIDNVPNLSLIISEILSVSRFIEKLTFQIKITLFHKFGKLHLKAYKLY